MGKATVLSVLVIVLSVVLYSLRVWNQGCVCEEIKSLSGVVAVITGGNAGLGYETVKGLARLNGTIFIACRNTQDGERARKEISSLTGNSNIEVMHLDLASLDSVRKFATTFKEKKLPINLLINNAGVWMGDSRQTTVDGFEMTFGVNHLGHFLLTNLLLDEIKQGKGRVITLSSGVHQNGVIDFNNLQLEQNYSHISAYGNSKLANILFSNELNRRLEGTGVTSNSLHPGVIATGLHRELEREHPLLYSLYAFFGVTVFKTLDQGAQTILTAALSNKFEGKGGLYLAECNVATPSPYAMNTTLAAQLWKVSADLVGLDN